MPCSSAISSSVSSDRPTTVLPLSVNETGMSADSAVFF